MQDETRQKYLHLKEPARVKNLRKLFDSLLTSDILSELLLIMKEHFTKTGPDVYLYLRDTALLRDQYSIPAMMMSAEDKANPNYLVTSKTKPMK